MTYECVNCYEEFDERTDQPSLRVCHSCAKTPNDIAEWQCPNCGWDSGKKDGMDDAPVVYGKQTSDWEYGWCGGAHWDETWTCPECSTVFTFRNSSV